MSGPSWRVAKIFGIDVRVDSRVRDHTVPLGGQVVVPPDAPMDQVMAKLEDGEAGRVLVAEDGEVVGIITSSDLTRWLRRWRALDSRERDGGERDGGERDGRAHQPDMRNLDRW